MTVAARIAREHFVPSVTRDVFIDNVPDENQIWLQLGRLTRLAQRKGYAVAIGHPHPTTIKVLANYLSAISKQEIKIVPITQLIELDPANRWPQYSSLSHKVVKN